MGINYRAIDGEELAWLAGWLEGEGCFYAYLTNNYFKIGVQGTSTDRDTIEKICLMVGGVFRGPVAGVKENHKDHYVWGVYGRDNAVDLMHRVRPYMSVRRKEQIDNALVLELTAPRRQESLHGTQSRYIHRGCRCEDCKRANTDACRAYRERRKEKV